MKPKPSWAWPASSITRVIDGDTIVARLTRDIGFHGSITFEQRLRLGRINTEPARTAAGRQATAYVSAHAAAGTVDITTNRAYKYGDEWMAEVVLPGGTNLSDGLVAAGLATYWDGTGARPGG